MTPGPEPGLILSWHAEQMADDRDRERENAQRVDQVEAGCAVHRDQQPDRNLAADPPLECGDGESG